MIDEGFAGRLEGRGRKGRSARTHVVAAGASSPRGLKSNVEGGAKAMMPRHACTSRGCAHAHHRREFLCFCDVFLFLFLFCFFVLFFLLSLFHLYFHFIFIFIFYFYCIFTFTVTYLISF